MDSESAVAKSAHHEAVKAKTSLQGAPFLPDGEGVARSDSGLAAPPFAPSARGMCPTEPAAFVAFDGVRPWTWAGLFTSVASPSELSEPMSNWKKPVPAFLIFATFKKNDRL